MFTGHIRCKKLHTSTLLQLKFIKPLQGIIQPAYNVTTKLTINYCFIFNHLIHSVY